MSVTDLETRKQEFLRDFLAAARSQGPTKALALVRGLCRRHGLTAEAADGIVQSQFQGDGPFSTPDEAEEDRRKIVAAQLRQEADDRLQTTAFLEEGDRQWAHRFGTQAGLGGEEIEQILDEREAANRRKRGRQTGWNRFRFKLFAVTSAICAAAAVGGIAFLAVHIAGDEADKQTVAGPIDIDQEPSPDEQQPADGKAVWWDADAALALREIDEKHPSLRQPAQWIRSGDDDKRRRAYRQLLSKLPRGEKQKEQRQLTATLIAGCFAREPSRINADSLRTQLMSMLPADDVETTVSAAADLEKPFWTIGVIGGILCRPDCKSEYADALFADLSARIDLPKTRDQLSFPAKYAAAFCRSYYRRLNAAAATRLTAAIGIEERLHERAQRYLTAAEREQLQSEFLIAALKAAPAQWGETTPLLQSTIKSSHLDSVAAVVDFYEESADGEFQTFVQSEFSELTGLELSSTEPFVVARSVRKKLGIALEPAAAFGRLARKLLLAKKADADDPAGLMREATRMAHASSLGCALSYPNGVGITFDSLLERYPIPLEEGAQAAADQAQAPAAAPAQPPAVDSFDSPPEQMDAAMRTLSAKPGQNESDDRIDALEVVIRWLVAGRKLNSVQAQTIARFLLRRKPKPEVQQVKNRLVSLRGSRKLLLAVADELETTRSRREDVEPVIGGLLSAAEGNDSAVDRTRWKADLRGRILRQVLSELDGGFSGDAAMAVIDGGSRALLALYKNQARLIGLPAARADAVERLSELLPLLAARLIDELRKQPNASAAMLNRVTGELKLHESANQDDLRGSILLQRAWLMLLSVKAAAERPAAAAEARQIVGELAASDQQATHLLEQLRNGEEAVLKMWLLIHTQANPKVAGK